LTLFVKIYSHIVLKWPSEMNNKAKSLSEKIENSQNSNY